MDAERREQRQQARDAVADSVELDAQIGVLIIACEQLWRTQSIYGLTTRQTRKPPADVLRDLRRWQQSLASVEASATLSEVVADGTAG